MPVVTASVFDVGDPNFIHFGGRDRLSGWLLSRLWRTESWLGRVLDPIADKLLVASVLVGLIAFRPTSFWITLVVYILLMRELLVSGLREAARGDDNLAVSMLGKAKTACNWSRYSFCWPKMPPAGA